MKRGFLVILALLMTLTMVIGSASAVSAAPRPPGTITVTITDWSYDAGNSSNQHIHYTVNSTANTASWGCLVYVVRQVDNVYTGTWAYTHMFSGGRTVGPWSISGLGGGLTGAGTYWLYAELVNKNGDVITKHGTAVYLDTTDTPIVIS